MCAPIPDPSQDPCYKLPDYYFNEEIVDTSEVVTDFDVPFEVVPNINSGITFPEPARRAGVSGRVTMEITISKYDAVQEIKVINGPGYCLNRQAVQAYMKASYTSAIKDGEPVKTSFTTGMNFNLSTVNY